MTLPGGGDDLRYHDHLVRIVEEDVRRTMKRDAGYGGSWRENPWENLRRKWDRIRVALAPVPGVSLRAQQLVAQFDAGEEVDRETAAAALRDLIKPAWDLFAAIQSDGRPEPVIRDVRDLRRYLLLVEAVAIEEGWAEPEPEED